MTEKMGFFACDQVPLFATQKSTFAESGTRRVRVIFENSGELRNVVAELNHLTKGKKRP